MEDQEVKDVLEEVIPESKPLDKEEDDDHYERIIITKE